MYKLIASIKKDFLVLLRDKVGLLLMFVMPVLLAVLITAIQNNTFKLVNDNKIPLLVSNHDTSALSREFVHLIAQSGAFEIKEVSASLPDAGLEDRMYAKDALVALKIPADYSRMVSAKASYFSKRVFSDLGFSADSSLTAPPAALPVEVLYHPVLQESFRQSVQGSLDAALQVQANKVLIRELYSSVNGQKNPELTEDEMRKNQTVLSERVINRNGQSSIPNATQHNIPAWTVFAMFFVVVSMGSSLVKEKLNGSFLRLRTIPSSYLFSLLSKQLVYVLVTSLQVAVIFAIGIFIFPHLGLPALNMPAHPLAVVVVSLICGWCAVSYAQCVGVFAASQEQANGFGAVTIVIFAAIGGLMVPEFAMPSSFAPLIKLSPLHWCLQSYYGLFLEGGSFSDILPNSLSLLAITFVFQILAFVGLKRKKLI